MHAEVKIGNSMLMLADENPERGHLSPKTLGGASASVMFYTDDVDADVQEGRRQPAPRRNSRRPTCSGAIGWRNLTDPFGHSWAIATHTKDVSPEEMEKAHGESGCLGRR